MVRKLTLENFKAFEKFTLWFKGDTMLVGPNNAGKSPRDRTCAHSPA